MFKLIVGGSAFLIAGIAAFFSIKGISLLFSGAFWAVVLMASSLEIGKLVATSCLYRYYHELNKAIRAYLYTAIVVLMAITSLGIFGFLTDAYNKSKFKAVAFTNKLAFVEEKKNSLLQKFEYNKERLTTLTTIRASQEQRISAISKENTSSTTSKKGGLFSSDQTLTVVDKNALDAKTSLIKSATTEIQSANLQLDEISRENDRLLLDIEEINSQILEVKQKESSESDIGTFKFIASAFNLELDAAVKYFILCLVLVFDPLAVILLIVFNYLIKKKNVNQLPFL
jgi:hypothetical protein